MKVSVIVPTFNANGRIANCIKSILSQKFDEFEVIVVNDGSTDSTAEIAKKSGAKVFSKINQGPAIARNFGAQKAKGSILVFIDDDCITEKNWLSEMVLPFEDKNVVGVQGAYKSRQKELCARFIQMEIEDRYEKIKSAKNIDWIGSYSAAYRRDVFFSVQGYDSSFPTSSGEDPELSFKLQKAGNRLVFNPKAIVFHQHDTDFFKYFKKKFFRAYWRVLLYKRHSDKIISDSYTPQSLKAQIILFYLLLAAPVFSFFFLNSSILLLAWIEIAMIFLISLLGISFTIKSLKKDFEVGMVSQFIIFARTASFGLGLIAGLAKGVWLR